MEFFTPADARQPDKRLAVVDGTALEKARFALSPKYGTLLDAGNSGIYGADTIGLDGYVIKSAFQDAYNEAAAESRRDHVRNLGEKFKNAAAPDSRWPVGRRRAGYRQFTKTPRRNKDGL